MSDKSKQHPPLLDFPKSSHALLLLGASHGSGRGECRSDGPVEHAGRGGREGAKDKEDREE